VSEYSTLGGVLDRDVIELDLSDVFNLDGELDDGFRLVNNISK